MTTTNQQEQQPTGRVAIYTRNAAATQSQTFLTQTSELLALVREKGYTTQQIVLFEDHAANSNRAALLELLLHITTPQPDQEPIKAVFVGSESRLFRDNEVVQVSAFIALCRTYHVLLITPTKVYDFSLAFDVAQFRLLCEQGYQFVNQMILSRLHEGKRRAAGRRQRANQEPAQ